MGPPIKCGAASLLSSILSWLGHNVLFHKDAQSPSSLWRASDGVKSGCSADGVKSGCSFNCLIGHVFLNPRGFRPWQLDEEHGLALERQAEENQHSEGLFELLALKRIQQESLKLTLADRPPLSRIQEAPQSLPWRLLL